MHCDKVENNLHSKSVAAVRDTVELFPEANNVCFENGCRLGTMQGIQIDVKLL